jgi:hypothetical protein
LMFRRESFAPSSTDPRTFHIRALEEGRFYEERVAKNLSDVVFQTVFPELAKAIATDKPEANLVDVRHAALILLYRLLFLLYAEDRNLLPVRDERYDDYGLRDKVRGDVGRRKDQNDTFSDLQDRYWSVIDGLSRAIDKGDASIGLPPYNGGLFNRKATPLLDGVHIADSVMAEVIDLLSYERRDGQRRYINYRDLSVQQLGSIYERLLEFEIRRDPDEGLVVRPNLFARKSSGSYYTPDELVGLILKETLEPMIDDKLAAFREKARELADADADEDERISQLRKLDPAEALLTLRICDPAMGSGHFLVNLVDYLADTVIDTLAEVTNIVDWAEEPYTSPLADRIADIRTTIKSNAEENNWTVDLEQLDDRHIIRRMVLKRCVYGVDKNTMAVELAKVSLWLHTFTVGAPLSFLDHHLRCGDSLFGETVGRVMKRLNAAGQELLISDALTKARSSAASMTTIEGLTDAEIAEAHRSAEIFEGVVAMTDPLDQFMKLIHAIDWLGLTDKEDKAAVQAWLDGQFGDPVEVARGKIKIAPPAPIQEALIPSQTPTQGDLMAPATPPAREEVSRFAAILRDAQTLIEEERFLNWEAAFPGVWRQWDGDRSGGFDAIVGNPPWDRIKLQEIEWFAIRDQNIAMAQRAADRKKLIKQLEKAGAPLFHEYTKAKARAETTSKMARTGGRYPLLSGGDTNLNSLFVERARELIKPGGMVGLLIPSGISTEKVSQEFFGGLITGRQASCCFDFFNRRLNGDLFFEDVYYRFKFTALVYSGHGRHFGHCRFATFVRDIAELEEPGRVFSMDLDHFEHVNPNSKTAPVYRALRDREMSSEVYDRLPVLVRHDAGGKKSVLPVRYVRMFDMANDSSKFRTFSELEADEGAWREPGATWNSPAGRWVPLYEGKMVQAYDHRASGIATVSTNTYRTGQAALTSPAEYADPAFSPAPRYFVRDEGKFDWEVAIKDVTSTTNARSLIACVIPPVGAGHTLPVLKIEETNRTERAFLCSALLAALNSVPLDFIARTKILSNHASWFILEQLPVVEPSEFLATRFGEKSARDIVSETGLELTYTAHDMAPFARDMGYVDGNGEVLPPFAWDEARRLRLKAKLDAVFFHLYGIFDPTNREQSRDDICYIYSTFPIVERQEIKTHDRYLSRDLALAYCNTLAAGQPDAEPEV